jgi:hypothetical protein
MFRKINDLERRTASPAVAAPRLVATDNRRFDPSADQNREFPHASIPVAEVNIA